MTLGGFFCFWLACISLIGCEDGLDVPPSSGAGSSAQPAALFVDVAAEAGLAFQHENGATGQFFYPELMQGGAAFVDYDNDSWLDVYLVQSGSLPPQPGSTRSNMLFRNLGGQSFEDVTESSGAGDVGYGSGVAAADFDADGWVDLYVTNLGANRLFKNQKDGSFVDVTERFGVGDPGYSTSATFLDFDRDGDLDLYVCNYVAWSIEVERTCLGRNGLRGYCSPSEYPPQADTLYRNDASRFVDVSTRAGISDHVSTGLGVVAHDFDADGWVDIYVANDQRPNLLWINQRDGTFREEALERGVALNELGQPEAGMGISAADPDFDGDLDLFVVHLSGETNTFYRNQGGFFRDHTDRLGLGSVSRPYTGFGVSFFDYDNDGRLDVFLANGKVSPGDSVRFEYYEPNQLLRGSEDGRYQDVSAQAGEALALLEVSRAAAFGDYDNDGDVDILLANNDGPARLLRNEVGSQLHWLTVELVGSGRDRDAIGSLVRIEVGGKVLRREVQPAYSYCASNDPRVHFGLGSHELVDSVEVTWPNGGKLVRRDVAADQILRLVEGSGPVREPDG